MTADISSVVETLTLKMDRSEHSDWLRYGQVGNRVNVELVNGVKMVGEESSSCT